jgi:hypothetical protein
MCDRGFDLVVAQQTRNAGVVRALAAAVVEAVPADVELLPVLDSGFAYRRDLP